MVGDRAKRGVPLHTKILIGLIVGAVAGVAANWLSTSGVISTTGLQWLVRNVTRPVGQVFLNMLFMVVMPIVFCSLSLGVAHLGGVGKLGRLGAKTFVYFFLTTAMSAALGLLLVNLVRPGEGFDRATQKALVESFGGQAKQRAEFGADAGFGPEMFVEIVSRNPIRDAADTKMLPVIFFAILFGLALTYIPAEKAEPTMKVVEGIGEAVTVIVGFAMRLAPYAVPALIFSVTALFGWVILKQLSFFVIMVFTGYLIHLFGTYSLLVGLLVRYSPRLFFKKVIPIMATAFSTSSSNATLPTTIKVSEEDLGVPSDISGFVLPLGATTNMNGTSLFEGMVVLFLAQVFGIELSLGMQVFVILLTVLTAIGAAGVPGGAIPLLVVVLETVGVRGEAIGIVIGVDRILDMGRTVLNVTGDVTAACFIARTEGYQLKTD